MSIVTDSGSPSPSPFHNHWCRVRRERVPGARRAFMSQLIISLQWIRADGAGEAQRLLESKNELRPYSFSPDGKRLAFAEFKRGNRI